MPDPDTDGDGVSTPVTILDIERALLVYATAALAAVDDQATDDARATLGAFTTTTKALKKGDRIKRCSTDVCGTIQENAETAQQLTGDAGDAVDAGEWDAARRSLQEVRRIVQGDLGRIVRALDGKETSGTNSLYEYLDGEPTIDERFVVNLPDAQVRGDGPALADELTPQRVLNYFTGDRDAEGCAESDEAVAVHRDLSCRDLLSATLTGPTAGLRGIGEKDIRRGLVAFPTSDGVVVTGATPDAEGAEPMLSIAPDTTVSAVDSLDSWGEEAGSGEATVSSVFVRPVAATPPDCPAPMPALFHVRRIRHDDQLLFVGGWHVDDGALYENAATLLVADGPNHVAGVTHAETDDGGVALEPQDGGDILLRKRPGRTKYGDITLTNGHLVREYMPPDTHPVCRDDGDVSYWGVQSHEALARHETGDCPGSDERDAPAWAAVTALDAPILHLVEAADASNGVKFKAGAELSKAVN